MSAFKFKPNILSANTLKLIAALAMLIDHMGMLLFPRYEILRIIGRIAFPIFAFFIAEGCKYTRSRARYLLTLASCAAVFQIVFFIVTKSLEMCIFVTFTLSVVLIYSLDRLKAALIKSSAPLYQKISYALLFLSMLVFVYAVNILLDIDYGFIGCITPLFAATVHTPRGTDNTSKLDKPYISVLCMALPISLMPFIYRKDISFFALASIPLLLLYSGKRGKLKMKYFFYVFYPLHLVFLYFLDYLI